MSEEIHEEPLNQDPKKDKEEGIKKQAEELESTIKKSEKELEEIQKACAHPRESNKIRNTKSTGGTPEIRVVCDLCGNVLRYPTKDELDSWTGVDKKD